MNEWRSHPDICGDWLLYIFKQCAPPFDKNYSISVFVGETSSLLVLNLIFCKSFLRIFQFHHPTPPQSNSLSRWRLSKKWQPPPLCAPCIAWNLTFFTHTSFFFFFLSFSLCLCFSHSRSSSRVLLWFCPAFCFIISHTRLDKHTLSCLEAHTYTHSNADWLDPDVFRHLFSGHLTL